MNTVFTVQFLYREPINLNSKEFNIIYIYSMPKTKKKIGYRGHATPGAFPKAMIFVGERDEICAP